MVEISVTSFSPTPEVTELQSSTYAEGLTPSEDSTFSPVIYTSTGFSSLSTTYFGSTDRETTDGSDLSQSTPFSVTPELIPTPGNTDHSTETSQMPENTAYSTDTSPVPEYTVYSTETSQTPDSTVSVSYTHLTLPTRRTV